MLFVLAWPTMLFSVRTQVTGRNCSHPGWAETHHTELRLRLSRTSWRPGIMLTEYATLSLLLPVRFSSEADRYVDKV